MTKKKSSVTPSGFTSASFVPQRYQVPTISLDEYEIDPAIIGLVSKVICLLHRVIPVSRTQRSLIVAMSNPTDTVALDALKLHTGCNVEPVVTTDQAIIEAITKYYGAAR